MSATAARATAVTAGRLIMATLTQGCSTPSGLPGRAPVGVCTAQHSDPCPLQWFVAHALAGADRNPEASDRLEVSTVSDTVPAGDLPDNRRVSVPVRAVSYTHLRAHETDSYLVCRLLLEKKK